jgi:hypothetical protein
VAGLLRGVRPMGLWSTLMTLSKCSMPSISSCGGRLFVRAVELRATAAYSVSLTSVLLPEPDTPSRR